MTVDQVLQLLEKGFTREEILSMGTEPAQQNQDQESGQDQKQDQDQNQDQGQNQDQNQEPAAAAEPAAAETEKRLDSIEASINKLIKAVQAQNLKNDSFGSMPESLEAETDKIMASIIRPESDKHNK